MGQYLGLPPMMNRNGTLLPTSPAVGGARNGISLWRPPVADSPADGGTSGEGTVTTMPFPAPTLTKGTRCPPGTVPLTVQAVNPDGSIGHKTVCRRIAEPIPQHGLDPTGGVVSPGVTPTLPLPPGVRPKGITPAAAAETGLQERFTTWLDEEVITGVPNKWLALGAVGIFLFLSGEAAGEQSQE